jgi:hypothetical protein
MSVVAEARPAPAVDDATLDNLVITSSDVVVLQWNALVLQAIRDTSPAPPVAARALAIAHTAMFDAWTAYDGHAVGTRLGRSIRRPRAERTLAKQARGGELRGVPHPGRPVPRPAPGVRRAAADPRARPGDRIGGCNHCGSEAWQPYFRPDVITPPFSDHVSGHSAFSAASATVLAAFTLSDSFGASATVRTGTSLVEPGATPSRDVTLTWPTFSAAADEAGFCRRLAGIHYRSADLAARQMERKVGVVVVAKALAYILGLARV